MILQHERYVDDSSHADRRGTCPATHGRLMQTSRSVARLALSIPPRPGLTALVRSHGPLLTRAPEPALNPRLLTRPCARFQPALVRTTGCLFQICARRRYSAKVALLSELRRESEVDGYTLTPARRLKLEVRRAPWSLV